MSEPLEEYDFALALALQTQFDKNLDSDDDLPTFDLTKSSTTEKTTSPLTSKYVPPPFQTTSSSTQPCASTSLLETSDIMDPRLETVDPNPDIRELFLKFNRKYFWSRLDSVEVRWSPRMTLCAGICCYEGRAGYCSIRLSQPLLKYRPRTDLVETLLHEMIHAYLFVTQNNKDHDGHGPEFHKHMYRINKASGCNITVYHSFHDEVAAQRTHWWKCDGPCQRRPPYFGIVKRSMNRAPSKNDPWWNHHRQTCGGKYTKIKEPEDYGKKKKKNKDDIGGKTSSTQPKNKTNHEQDGNNKKRHPGLHDLSKFLSKTSTNILGGNTQEINPRGVPLNSRLLQGTSNFSSIRKTKKKIIGKKPTSAVQLTDLLRLEGRLSVCHGASAYKTKALRSFDKKFIFDDDDYVANKSSTTGTNKPTNPKVATPLSCTNSYTSTPNTPKPNNEKKRLSSSPTDTDKENYPKSKKFCPSKNLDDDVLLIDSDNEGEITLQSLMGFNEPALKKSRLSWDSESDDDDFVKTKPKDSDAKNDAKSQQNGFKSNSSFPDKGASGSYKSSSSSSSSWGRQSNGDGPSTSRSSSFSIKKEFTSIQKATRTTTVKNEVRSSPNGCRGSGGGNNESFTMKNEFYASQKASASASYKKSPNNKCKTSPDGFSRRSSTFSVKEEIISTQKMSTTATYKTTDYSSPQKKDSTKNNSHEASTCSPSVNKEKPSAKSSTTFSPSNLEDESCTADTNASVPEIAGGEVYCPVCNQNVITNNINAHIDSCLTLIALKNGDL